MIKDMVVVIALLIGTIGISLGVMQSVEREREIRKLDKEFKQAMIKSVQNNGECK